MKTIIASQHYNLVSHVIARNEAIRFLLINQLIIIHTCFRSINQLIKIHI